MPRTLNDAVKLVYRQTGLRLDPGMGTMLFLSPVRGPDRKVQYGTLRVGFERGCHVVFQLTEDLPEWRADRAAVRNGPVTQNWIEMFLGYGEKDGFRSARLMRTGGVDLLSNGQPVGTDPSGRRSVGVPLRVASVYERIRAIGFTHPIQGRPRG